MQHILVTGGAGYIGGHFVKMLLEETDFVIHILDNFSQSKQNVLNNTRITYHEMDIRNETAVRELFKKHNFDSVCHFAALASVPDSVINPAAYYAHNVTGLLNILEAMRETGVKKILFSSSAAVYGEPETEEIDEQHPTRPKNPYGETKLIGERILRDYFEAYQFSSISFRYFCAAGADESGVIGEWHTPETHVIPVLIETALGKRDTFFVFGNDYPTPDGSGVRDYIHVVDLARAHILGLARLAQEPICTQYNLGINKGFSVMELIAATERIVGHSIPYAIHPRRTGDPARLIAKSNKAMQELSWKPIHSDVEDMIQSTFDSFKRRS